MAESHQITKQSLSLFIFLFLPLVLSFSPKYSWGTIFAALKTVAGRGGAMLGPLSPGIIVSRKGERGMAGQ
jgi:hypothetical protein